METKANEVEAAMGATPGTWIQVILSIFQTVLGSGLCPAPTPAQAKQMFAHPTRMQQRILRRTIRRHVSNPAVEAAMEEAFYHVGQRTTEQEAMALFNEANHAQAHRTQEGQQVQGGGGENKASRS